ncbi:hypothetical protein [Olivibacter sp. SDN3]|uniref:hypothetical protein n=1 Tax=Olivibacter sp. SDN3 TaxID=2764720 RepID=UPI001C9E2433|nr:hypothetical protein [Olivibacter sp. SDN3]
MQKKGLAKGSREETAKLNRFLARFKAKIIDAYQALVLSGSTVEGAVIRGRVMGSAQHEHPYHTDLRQSGRAQVK